MAYREDMMTKLIKFIFGSKQQQTTAQKAVQTVKETKLSIEETIRRYEQLCAK